MLPVFENLYTKHSGVKKPLSVNDRIDLCEALRQIDPSGAEIVYAIIVTYHTKEYAVTRLPYSAIDISNDCIEFNLSKLPIILQYILQEFISIHSDVI